MFYEALWLRWVNRFEAPIQPLILCCEALPYMSTVCGFASRLRGCLGVVVIDLVARCASLIVGFADSLLELVVWWPVSQLIGFYG